jgi:flavin-binding protein dodecin
MSVAKIIEINAASTQSFEDAVRVGIEKAAKTLTGIQGAWVKEQKVVVKDGKVQEFRVDLKITFLLED